MRRKRRCSIDASTIAWALHGRFLDIAICDEFFLCGPEAMISEVTLGLRGLGIGEARIHFELFFASAADARRVVASHQARAGRYGDQICRVAVKAGGRTTEFELASAGENILDGALNAGIDLPFSCRGGVCATCKARVLEGEVEMDLNHAFDDWFKPFAEPDAVRLKPGTGRCPEERWRSEKTGTSKTTPWPSAARS